MTKNALVTYHGLILTYAEYLALRESEQQVVIGTLDVPIIFLYMYIFIYTYMFLPYRDNEYFLEPSNSAQLLLYFGD